jgi:uncharacterized protein (TIGR02145 family)
MRAFFLLAFFFSSVSLIGQTPSLIPYQAVARDGSGDLIPNQTLNIRFTIHEGSAQGGVLWQETQAQTTNELGIFAAMLGDVVPLSELNWQQGVKFLRVEINTGNGFLDMGSEQLLSVPYALHSRISQQAGNGVAGISETGDSLKLSNGSFFIIPGLHEANAPVSGCTDSSATNYNAAATIEDGHCCYSTHYTLESSYPISWYVYSASGSYLADGSSNEEVGYCAEGGCATIYVYPDEQYPFSFSIKLHRNGILVDQVYYSPYYGEAMFNIADSAIPGCFDMSACNYDSTANCIDNSLCNFDCYGCTNSSACNYSSTATLDDGTCYYPGGPCNDNVSNTVNDVWTVECMCAGSPLSAPHSCGAQYVHNPNLQYGTVLDQDGNEYKTIVIGTQEWMAENLKTTIYRNGDTIPTNLDAGQWASTTSGAWSYYNDNPTYLCPYGRLYNWYAVDDERGLCPTGWHVASNDDWNTLISYIDPQYDPFATNQSGIAGGALKSIGTIEAGTGYWGSPNTGATNIYGFSALPTGARVVTASGGWIGTGGNYWTSTPSSGNMAYVHGFFYMNSVAYLAGQQGNQSFVWSSGWGVRCIKDN